LENNQNFDGYVYKRNIFSHDLLKIMYTDPEMKYLCEQEPASSTSDNNGESGYDGKNGVRCLKVSPDGIHLASGDRSGNINVKDLSSQIDVCKIEAHDSEVLCLEYSDPQTCGGNYLLCSASRDRLIHLFDVEQQYSFVQTLDDHNSAITAIKFVPDADSLQLLSCGADKSIIFRRMSTDKKGASFTREHHVVGKTTLYDMELDHDQTSILTACQDRQIRVYSVDSAKLTSTMKGTLSEEGTLIKIAMDPSGQYFATSSTDKLLSIFDYQTGECVATASGHSELITGLKFSVNGRTLTSVSGDGCIFVWKLPIEVANAISSKLGLPPVPPEKPAFFSALRSQADLGPDLPIHRPSTLPIIPKIKLDTDEYIRKLSDNNSLKRTELFITNNRFPKERLAAHETETLPSPCRDGKNDEDSGSSKTLSVRSDEETPSGSDIVYYYPQDDDSLQRNSFEIRTDGLSYQGSGTPTSSHNLKNSLSVSNFNDSPSDEEEKEDSEMSAPAFRMDTSHRRRNPLYASNENVSAMRRALHSNFAAESCSEQDEGERDLNRTSLSSRFALSRGAAGRATTPSRDTMTLSRSTSVSSLSGNKRREELSKAMGEARRRLESVSALTVLHDHLSITISCSTGRMEQRPEQQ
jgi:WD40 repeat protein